MTDDGSRMYLVTSRDDPGQPWTPETRVQFFRDTFRHEMADGADELALFARLVAVLGEPARLLAELRVGLSERREADIRAHAAVGLDYVAAAAMEVAERLREPSAYFHEPSASEAVEDGE